MNNILNQMVMKYNPTNIDYENAKSDVINFLKQKESLDLWCYDFFSKISKNIKYE